MMVTVKATITEFLSRGSKEEVLLKKITAIGLGCKLVVVKKDGTKDEIK